MIYKNNMWFIGLLIVILMQTMMPAAWAESTGSASGKENPHQVPTVEKSSHNWIKNSSFELAGSNAMPEYWHYRSHHALAIMGHRTDAFSHTGRYSINLANTDKHLGPGAGIIWIQSQVIPKNVIWPKGQIQLSVWVRANKPDTKFRFYIENLGKDRLFKSSEWQTAHTHWTQYSLFFHLPSKPGGNTYVVLQLHSTGKIWFDDIYLGAARSSAAQTPGDVIFAKSHRATKKTDKAKQYKIKLIDAKLRKRMAQAQWVDLPYRNTIYLPHQLRALHLKLNSSVLSGYVRIIVKNSGGNIITQQLFKQTARADDNSMLTLPLPPLEPGTYLATATVSNHPVGLPLYLRVAGRQDKGKAVHARNDGVLIVNGKPIFPIGTTHRAETLGGLKQQAKVGFNMIAVHDLTGNVVATNMILNTTAKLGLYVVDWVNLADHVAGMTDKELRQYIHQRVLNVQGHHNFIGWLDDEPVWHGVPLISIKRAYQMIWQEAPRYLYWDNTAPRGSIELLKPFSRFVDITGGDIYPIGSPEHSGLKVKGMHSVGLYAQRYNRIANHQKPVWMMLQAWSWNHKPADRPTEAQLRFMTFDALVYGAKGLWYFGDGTRDFDSPFFHSLTKVLSEVHAVVPALISQETPPAVHVEAGDDITSLRCSVKGKPVILLVNHGKRAVNFKLSNLHVHRLYEWIKGESAIVRNHTFIGNLKPMGVAIYATHLSTIVPSSEVLSRSEHTISGSTPVSESTARHGYLGMTLWQGKWVAHPKFLRTPNTTVWARQTIHLPGSVKRAWITIAVDNQVALFINGSKVGSYAGFKKAASFDIAPYLRAGSNTFGFRITNANGPTGLLYQGGIKGDGWHQSFASGNDTKFLQVPVSDTATHPINGKWLAPDLLGTPPAKPWGQVSIIIPIH